MFPNACFVVILRHPVAVSLATQRWTHQVDSEDVSPGVVLDFNESNEVVGVEMLHLSRRSTKLNLSALHFETA